MAFWQFKQFKVVFPMMLLLLLFLDGTIMSSLNSYLTPFPLSLLPNLTFVWLFYAVQFERQKDISYLLLALLIGLLFDVYYTGLFGTYAFSFWASAYILQQIHAYYTETLTSAVFQLAIGLVIFYTLVYFSGVILGAADVNIISYARDHIVPTIVLNITVMVLFYYPVWRWFQNLT
jgi:rod shape-determining protein MreD